ncbi:hypothetical protein HPB47_011618 [Ixodes persulcatus]|uniref:Uncharacterized protein n=1 Tax=Ixodes persulcatus TaxID=34615 RepID=A0AC60NVT0_IXOPE|nr:hypothetical protein HPB47_011618 [Ixodes persulcatus]
MHRRRSTGPAALTSSTSTRRSDRFDAGVAASVCPGLVQTCFYRGADFAFCETITPRKRGKTPRETTPCFEEFSVYSRRAWTLADDEKKLTR